MKTENLSLMNINEKKILNNICLNGYEKKMTRDNKYW